MRHAEVEILVAVTRWRGDSVSESGVGQEGGGATSSVPSPYRQRVGEPQRIPLMLFDKTAKMPPIVYKSSVGDSVGAQDSGSRKEIC